MENSKQKKDWRAIVAFLLISATTSLPLGITVLLIISFFIFGDILEEKMFPTFLTRSLLGLFIGLIFGLKLGMKYIDKHYIVNNR